MSATLFDQVLEIARDASRESSAAAAIQKRLDGPIAVALAGRINAGKSTLLNALLGERLALTDATECTRLVCRYSYGQLYSAGFANANGTIAPSRFERSDDGMRIDVPESGAPRTLAVTAPNPALRAMTLIDTPGLGSEDAARLAATGAALGTGETRESEADAVVYLLRHAHRSDVDTLEALRDRWAGNGSAFNVIAVLSRADEIGGGRLDAMDSAAAIAARYEEDGRLRGLATTVVAISGLLAETGSTLRQEEFGWLRLLAGQSTAEVDRLLLAASLLLNATSCPLTVEVRRLLLARFGLFGLRVTVAGLRDGSIADSQGLARKLVELSGLQALRVALADQFGRRARELQAVAALDALGRLGRSLQPPPQWLALSEQVAASSAEVAEMMALQAATDGLLDLAPEDQRRLTLLLAGSDAASRLGLGGDTPRPELSSSALRAIGEWRALAANPMANRLTVQVCETAARAAERIYAELGH